MADELQKHVEGFVYIASDGADRIKVGFSINPAGRILELSRQRGIHLVALRIFEGARADEAAAHRLLLDFTESREWYRMPDGALSQVLSAFDCLWAKRVASANCRAAIVERAGRIYGGVRNHVHPGAVIGRLTVTLELPKKGNRRRWSCHCECGKTASVGHYNLRYGNTQSCGCLLTAARSAVGKANVTHGLSGTPTYASWQSMLSRCYSPTNVAYKNYGGRGISVCNEWRRSVTAFVANMGICPSGFTLERKNCNGNYEPTNCEWASVSAQGRNKRNNRLITMGGETRCLSDWLERKNIPRHAYGNLTGSGIAISPEEAILRLSQKGVQRNG